MQEPFKKPNISESEAKELTEYVQNIIMIDYATFEECKEEFKWHWSKIMKFFMLPHTALHDQYLKWIAPCREAREKKDSWIILGKMDDNKEQMMNDNNLMDTEVKYQIIKVNSLYHKFWWKDECITIWIPYFDNTEKRNRFYWTINIYKSKTPVLYESMSQNLRRFSWDADIMLH